MWWAIFKYVSGGLTGIAVSVIFSGAVQAWPQDTAPKFIINNTKVTHSYTCNGEHQDIRVSGQGSINACVMGQGVRVASYYPIQGPISHVISFPFDDVFYPLDVCTTFWGCSYSETSDTFVGFAYAENSESRGVVYKDFAKNLQKSVQNGVSHYGLSEDSPVFEVKHPAGSTFYTQNLATSSNGKWSIFEIRNYGYYRINNQTLEVRRVVAPGNIYSYYGTNPSVQLTISNDGKAVAIMGERMSFSLIIVNDTCGDRLTQNTQTSFVGAVTACRYVNANPYDYAPNFVFASKPRFSQDSKRLSFDLYPYMSEVKRVTLFADDVDTTTQYLSQYLAVGDSFVSGEGETDDSFYVGSATNKCHVSLRSYPYLLAGSWDFSAHNVACSGATTETAKSKPGGGGQLTQIEEIESKLPRLLTIGIGGNDAGLMGKLKTCIGIGTCEWANDATKRASTAVEIKKLYPKLKAFYGTVQSRTTGKVVVIGYPLIISTDAVCFAGIGSLLDQTERRFMNEGIKYLNSVVKAAANDSGIEFVDIENALKGGELCSLNFSQSMNGLQLGDDYPALEAFANIKVFGAESFHPNPTGHQKIAQSILANNQSIFAGVECFTCGGYIGAPDPSSYWDNGIAVKNQNAFPFLNTNTVTEGGLLEISFPALSFAADTEVTIELHSTVRTIAKVKAAEDGSLKTTIKVTDFEKGHHSIHLLGKNTADDDIDVYDFIVVTDSEYLAPVNIATVAQSGTLAGSTFTQPILQSNKTRKKDDTSAVMGVATVAMPASAPPVSTKLTPSLDKDKNINDPYPVVTLIAIGVAVISLLVAASTYGYYRKKQARYDKG